MLKGKTVVITGAGSGLGEAWTYGFLKEGAVVVAADIDQAGLDRVAAAGARTIRTNVAKEDDVATMIDFTISETGRVDVLFNNAGIGINRPFVDVKHGEFEKHMAVHVFGTVYGMRYALPHMLQQGSGRIINTLSRAAEICGPANAAYSAAKAAIWATSCSAEKDLRNVDILVNMLIPGPTNTAIWGRDMPNMQSADVTYPTARMLATLPADGPRGKVFWDEKEYPMFASLYSD